jgi:hypothetical protein
VKTWTHGLNGEFSKEAVQMANKYIKKCSTSLAIKEIQIKLHKGFRMAMIKSKTTNAD